MKKRVVVFLVAVAFTLGVVAFLNINKSGYENDITPQEDKSDLIIVTSPTPDATISSPITVTGRARGNWFFEASFPLILVDWDGRIIAQGYASAKGDWMTTDFVPFGGTLEFSAPEHIGDFSDRGAIIFKKDNPSGLPEHDDALEVPIYFSR